MVLAQASGRLLGQRVAVPLAVRRPHECGDDVEIPVLDVGGFPPQVREAKVDVQLQEVDTSWALWHNEKGRTPVGRRALR